MPGAVQHAVAAPDGVGLKSELVTEFGGLEPAEWGETLSGVRTRLKTDEKVVAITLDACGSENDGYDEKLITFLESEKISATLFINARWIEKNPEVFARLAENPLFEIENHGLAHRPASVTGRSVYGIQGTGSIAELVDEIEINAHKIESLTGRKPQYYRSGTAYYDEVAVRIVERLGYAAVGFDILGDKGATYSSAEVKQALLEAVPGSIAIFHMNHPERETAEGLMEALPILRERGFRFVLLKNYSLE
jgi:peptidoglycan/xylan/chitin deacetylase (PgdA/CDA1 family)